MELKFKKPEFKKTRKDGSDVNFNFILTHECNWHCKYCQFPGMEQKKPDLKTVQMHLEYIRDFNISGYMDVQGGEIGLVPVEILECFFQMMNRKFYVSTNGIFLNRKLHLNEKIRPYIKAIQWHMFPDPDGFIHIEDIKDSGIVILRGIVHDDENEIIDFIESNEHIYFEYIDFEYDITEEVEYNREKYRNLFNRLNHMINVSEGAKQRIRKRAQEPEDLRNFCRDRNNSIVIDLVNEKICHCQRNMHVNEELGVHNLFERCWNDPVEYFLLKDLNCKSCGRLYEGKTRRLQRV